MFGIRIKPKKNNKGGNFNKENTENRKNSNDIQTAQASAIIPHEIEQASTIIPYEIEQEEESKEISSFYPTSYRLMEKRVQFLFPRLTHLERKLKQAGMPVTYKAYVCGLALLSLVIGIAGVAIGIGIALTVNIDPPEFGFLLPVLLGTAGFQGTFVFMLQYPNMNIKARSTKIVGELPYFIGYMATLSASGLKLEDVFKAIAKEEFNEELVKDARVMVRNLEVLGMDIITAIKDLIERAPPGPYSELMEGLISTVQSGGNLREFFVATAKVQLEEKKLLLRKMTSSLGMVAEMYTILLIVAPLMGTIMLSIMAIMTPNLGGFGLTTLMMGLSYGLVPIFGIMMLIMIDAMVPKR